MSKTCNSLEWWNLGGNIVGDIFKKQKQIWLLSVISLYKRTSRKFKHIVPNIVYLRGQKDIVWRIFQQKAIHNCDFLISYAR